MLPNSGKRVRSIAWAVVANVSFALPAFAEIVPDATLPEPSTVQTEQNLHHITGGTAAGTNLFHSFDRFDVLTGETARFENTEAFDRVFTRVTGNNVSTIDGLLQVNGTADLFFINPNGIVFGENARLDVGGSFIASSANGVIFQDGIEFKSTASETPLLSVNVPLGLQLGSHPGSIHVEGVGETEFFPMGDTGLHVSPRETLALVGGNIDLVGGVLRTASGQLNLTSAIEGTVELTPAATGWQIDANAVEQFGTLRLSERAAVFDSAELETLDARVRVTAGKIDLAGRSRIASATIGPFDSNPIEIRAEQLSATDGSFVQTFSLGSGDAGDIWVEADTVILQGFNREKPTTLLLDSPASRIGTGSFWTGAVGNIDLRVDRLILRESGIVASAVANLGEAGDRTVEIVAREIEASGANPFLPLATSGVASLSFGEGDSSALIVTADRVTLQDGAQIQSAVQGSGRSGDLTVNVRDSIVASGTNPFAPVLSTGILSTAWSAGGSGDIQVSASRLHLESGAQVGSLVLIRLLDTTFPAAGTGNAGNVTVAADSISIVGAAGENPSQIGSVTFGSGRAGDVTVSARQLEIRDGADLISTSALSLLSLGEPMPLSGTGDGGNVTVRVDRSLSVAGRSENPSKPSTIGTSTFGNGTGGRTDIVAGEIWVSDGATIAASTFGRGNAGRLSIEASSISVSGEDSSISAQAQILGETARTAFFLPEVPTGNTGTLNLRADTVTISDNGRISVQHDGVGNAGQLNARASLLQLERGGQISAETASGLGGDLQLDCDGIHLNENSSVTATAGRMGNGGNISLEATTLILERGSTLAANAFDGDGGNVRVIADGVFVSPDSAITASSNLGIDGSIEIVGFNMEANVGLPSLHVEPVDVASLVNDPCYALRSGSEFIISGRGGMPNDPFVPIEGRRLWRDLRSIEVNELPEERHDNPTIPEERLVEANAWTVRPDGSIELLAIDPAELPLSIFDRCRR